MQWEDHETRERAMSLTDQHVNESAATLRWLVTHFGMEGADGGPVQSAWNEARSAMRQVTSGGQLIMQSVDWVSDFWLTRGAATTVVGLAPRWMPPDDIDQWPAFDVQSAIAPLADRSRRSAHDTFARAVRSTAVPVDDGSAAAALDRYLDLKASLVPRLFDSAAIHTEHVRVWLASSVGHLLMSAALTPESDVDAMAGAVEYRLQVAQYICRQQETLDQLGDRSLEILYNARMQADGRVRLGAVRIGQGEEWRDHWLTLTFDVDAQDTLDAVRMAAVLMRCPSLVLGLGRALTSSDPSLRMLAVAVVRRWILTLKAMAWLEAALQQPWSDVRPKDLCCFALNAVKPDWPRRVVGLSHRSKDVKPELRGMSVWRAGRFAIDANYVPSWESNVGMVWGLFAATPAIVRVQSPGYADSAWCRREREVMDYLLTQRDFLTERWIIDIEHTELGLLDRIAHRWNQESQTTSSGPLPEFPPITEVCSPSLLPAWEARMLRAAAALRVMHTFLVGLTPEVVNRLALHLQMGGELPAPAPTNNPDGWQAYGEIFREACEASAVAEGELAVRLPDSYGDEDRQADLLLGQRIPDMQSGDPSLRDVLVAMEWLRVEYPQFVERGRGDFLAINCQRVSREAWKSGEEVSLHRGLAAMRSRLPVPLWIIQTADQDVEFWPLIGDTPIFTEHVEAQFGWMLEGAYDRRDSQARYQDDSGLILAPALEAKCADRNPDRLS